MTAFHLSIGSNIEPAKNIPACHQLLERDFRILKVSNVYESEPEGPSRGQAPFWNLVVTIESDLQKTELLKKLKSIECQLGRVRDPGNKFTPRTIDIDLLPEPGFQNRPFIMIPLAEVAADEIDPETGQTHRQLADHLAKEENRLRKVQAGI